MIERYTRPAMGAVWTEQNRFQKWLDVELAVCDVHAEMGTIPAAAVDDWRQHLRQQAVPIESEVTWDGGARSLYFRDPDNHVVELITPGFWAL